MSENGLNFLLQKEYENSLDGIKMQGYPGGLAQALANIGYKIPYAEKKDVPGKLDNLADALASDDNELHRTNFKGQKVQKRAEEYMEDRQDYALGALSDYFLSPALKIANAFNQGYQKSKRDGLKSAEDFIEEVNARHPLSGLTKEPKEETEITPVEPATVAPGTTITEISSSAYASGFGNYTGEFGNYNPSLINYSVSQCGQPCYSKPNTVKSTSRKPPSKSKPKRSARSRGSSGNTTNNNTATGGNASAVGNSLAVYISEPSYAPKKENKSPIPYIV
jgi:hypothetical protein